MLTNKICLRSKLTKNEWQEFRKPVWEIPAILSPKRKDYQNHSAVFPQELVKRLIKMYSFVGDVVLDPFAGSGTVLLVAQNLGRQWIGYELYENYSDIINQKLRKYEKN